MSRLILSVTLIVIAVFIAAPAAAADARLSAGLVGQWRFDGSDGQTVKDRSPLKQRRQHRIRHAAPGKGRRRRWSSTGWAATCSLPRKTPGGSRRPSPPRFGCGPPICPIAWCSSACPTRTRRLPRPPSACTRPSSTSSSACGSTAGPARCWSKPPRTAAGHLDLPGRHLRRRGRPAVRQRPAGRRKAGPRRDHPQRPAAADRQGAGLEQAVVFRPGRRTAALQPGPGRRPKSAGSSSKPARATTSAARRPRAFADGTVIVETHGNTPGERRGRGSSIPRGCWRSSTATSRPATPCNSTLRRPGRPPPGEGHRLFLRASRSTAGNG